MNHLDVGNLVRRVYASGRECGRTGAKCGRRIKIDASGTYGTSRSTQKSRIHRILLLDLDQQRDLRLEDKVWVHVVVRGHIRLFHLRPNFPHERLEDGVEEAAADPEVEVDLGAQGKKRLEVAGGGDRHQIRRRCRLKTLLDGREV
jgi:hypothetical protein